MINLYKQITFSLTILIASYSSNSLASLLDLAADKTIETLLSQTPADVFSCVKTIPNKIQEKLKRLLFDKYQSSILETTNLSPKEYKYLASRDESNKKIFLNVDNRVFSSDNKFVLVAGKNGAGYWDLNAGIMRTILKGHTKEVTTVALSSCNKYALTGSADESVRLWDIINEKLLQEVKLNTGKIMVAAFATSGDRALIGTEDGTLYVWDLITDNKIIKTLPNSIKDLKAIAFSSCCNYALISCKNAVACLLDTNTGVIVQEFKGHANDTEITAVALSSDSRFVLTASRNLNGTRDYIIRLWDVATGIILKELKDTWAIHSLALSPDNKYALTARYDSVARVWDLSTGKQIKGFEASRMEFSCCGNYALTNIGRDTIGLWTLPFNKLEALSLEQLLFISNCATKNIDLEDIPTQKLLLSLSSLIDPFYTLPGKDYTKIPLIKAYIDLRRRQLFFAAANDDIDTVKTLVEKGFKTEYTFDKNGNSLWHYAFKGYVKDSIFCPSQNVLAYLLELEGKREGLIKPNKQGLYPFTIGLMYHAEFTMKFISNCCRVKNVNLSAVYDKITGICTIQ
ncbi:WD40 repeat domain-containing protein [Candidatus Dependentiae bacterium]|nr:WD40 repeat domain-containing protein [Candidatus Dependentiae bacterium]